MGVLRRWDRGVVFLVVELDKGSEGCFLWLDPLALGQGDDIPRHLQAQSLGLDPLTIHPLVPADN